MPAHAEEAEEAEQEGVRINWLKSRYKIKHKKTLKE